MNSEEIMKLLSEVGQMEGIAEIRSFRAIKNGHNITIQIHDEGTDAICPEARYSCKAIRDDGLTASGNPFSDVHGAIINVHWSDLN